MTSALHLTPRGDMDALGVRLQPMAGACLLPSALLTGTLHSMDSVLGPWARRVREQVGNERGEANRAATMFACLRQLLDGKSEPDAAIASSVQRIERAGGCGDMDGFMPPGLQTRQWQRRFVASTGLTPKAFARVVRLQKLVALYQSGRWRRWVDLALESGFFVCSADRARPPSSAKGEASRNSTVTDSYKTATPLSQYNSEHA